MAKVSKRTTKTVKKTKKTYEYSYRVSDNTFIRLSGKGYQKNKKLTKLQFKSGKLTKAGEEYLAQLNQIADSAQRRYMIREFETYRHSGINKGEVFTLERFESHLAGSKLERMIYNFGSTPDEIAEMLNATVKGLSVSGSDVLSMNWNFDSNTITYGKYTWQMNYDYQSANGFQFALIKAD